MSQEILSIPAAVVLVSLSLLLTIIAKISKRVALTNTAKAPPLLNLQTEQTAGPVDDIMGIAKISQPVPALYKDEIPAGEEDEVPYTLENLPSDEELQEWITKQEGVLLKEAEQAAEYIQLAIDNASSYPTTKKKLAEQLNEILVAYYILLETEYFNSINQFIKMAVKRSFADIEFTDEEINVLWKE